MALWLATLSPDDAAAFRRTMALPRDELTTVAIYDIVIRHGFPRNDKTLNRHRNGQCLCPR